MDFAIIDAEKWKSNLGIEMCCSKENIDPVNPIICIANYLFDSLHHDAYSVAYNTGDLEEWRVKVESSYSPLEPEFLPSVIETGGLIWKKEFIQENINEMNTNGPYVFELYLNQILRWYQLELKHRGASFVLPVGALRLIEQLRIFSNGRLLMITGDKADSLASEFSDENEKPEISDHQGCFSFTTNLDAIGKYFHIHGGVTFHGFLDNQFRVSLFLMDSKELSDLPDFSNINCISQHSENCISKFLNLSLTFSGQQQFGPENYFNLYKGAIFLKKQYKTLKNIGKPGEHSLKRELAFEEYLGVILAQLRLSNYDSDLFMEFKKGIASCIVHCEETNKSTITKILYRIWENDYYIPNIIHDVAFAIGEILQLLDLVSAAISFFIIASKRLTKETDQLNTYYNIAMSYLENGDTHNTIKYLLKCQELDPDDEDITSKLHELSHVNDCREEIKPKNILCKTRQELLAKSQEENQNTISPTLEELNMHRCRNKYI